MQLGAASTIGLFFTGFTRSASASDVDDALAEIKAARANLKTMKGPFTQERTIGLLATKVKSTGTLTMVRPDRLRWELAPPDDVVYWVGPEGFSYKNARGQGHLPAAAGRLASAMEDVRIILGGDLDQLKKRYDLTLAGKTPDEVSFVAIPKPAAGDIRMQKILFSLGKDRSMPTKATLIESEKDKTEITFGTMQKDPVIDPAFIRPSF
ncbi:MAG TPA: outer membrane lipoprotein carrier protein LolA [Polyangiaceae bacterium]